MSETTQSLDNKIGQHTAKDAMQQVVEFMKTEGIHVIEIVTLDTLRNFEVQENWEQQKHTFDIVLADNKAILDVAGVEDEQLMKEAESSLFIKMFLQFLHKNQLKVLLLTEDQDALQELREYIEAEYDKIQIIETAVWEEDGVSEDKLLNCLNGAESECILAALPSPMQEEFIIRNRAVLNTKIWFGMGTKFHARNNKKGIQKMYEALTCKLIKREIKKARQQDGEK